LGVDVRGTRHFARRARLLVDLRRLDRALAANVQNFSPGSLHFFYCLDIDLTCSFNQLSSLACCSESPCHQTCFAVNSLVEHFQEESSVKLSRLAVLALLVLGCSVAFGQNFSFGFLSYDGSIQYCDYETLTVSAPYAAGTHVLTSCGLPLNGVMVGFKTFIPLSTGQPVVGN